ncbi:MAG: flagellar export chaperone FlgN [Phycisphaerales bacterium]|nr:flagellar export chaperone FlgN [Phycisphaerales bacterium]
MINTPIQPTRTKRPPQANPIAALDLDKLESLLADLETEHERLLELAGLQREAIINADAKGLGEVVEQTTQTLGRIAGIERSRQQTIKLPDGSIPSVQQITSQVDPDHASTLNDRSTSLRTLMLKVKQEHEAVRLASQALSNHMNGLMEQITAKLSHTGTYGRRGSVTPARAQVVSSLDTTS